jgi:uncharacterized protein (DUF1330 family)
VTIHLSVLLWERPGQAAALGAYEDQVLPLLADHGGRVVSRVRRAAGEADGPLETHLLRLPSQAALDAYMADERRVALATARDAAIERTEIQRVDVV